MLMHRYAQRIHFFEVSDAELDMIDSRVVQALISASSPTPLLPNLRRLHWLDDRKHYFPLLHALLGSTITSLDLGCIKTPSFASSALLTSLEARCPFIRELDCHGVCSGDSEESSNAIFEALCGLRELFRFDTGARNSRELIRLASLPSLKILNLDLKRYNANETQPNSTPTIFSQLSEVRIVASSHSVVHHCLKNVRWISCRSFTTYINLPYDPRNIPDLIVTVSECFSPALEASQFGFDAITPLLSQLQQSWPRLRNFWFGGAASWLIPPTLTFMGLVYLIHYCPHLRTIVMSFCACPVDINSELFSNTIPNTDFGILSVGMSPIIDPTVVADQLRRLLPDLTKVEFPRRSNHSPPVPPPFENYEDGWSRVNELLEVDLDAYDSESD
ncbi:hypothetical protein EDB19DRAFT_1655738 [Suillus lakei]|nr:hypothetical protein EDB19DRAFT_1655738 [Suillus lakei]